MSLREGFGVGFGGVVCPWKMREASQCAPFWHNYPLANYPLVPPQILNRIHRSEGLEKKSNVPTLLQRSGEQEMRHKKVQHKYFREAVRAVRVRVSGHHPNSLMWGGPPWECHLLFFCHTGAPK